MDAVHLMRAVTGRDLIIKVEGCYHGHHDSVQVSVLPEADEVGPAGHARSASPATPASPRRSRDLIADRRRSTTSTAWPGCSTSTPARSPGMILEPVMMNAGIIPPEPGYLAGLRDLLHAHGALLDLRRGQDRAHRRPGRRHRGCRRARPTWSAWPRRSAAACPSPRSAAPSEVMAHDRRRRLRAGRHVQRQPAGDGRRPGDADRGARRPRRTRTSTRCAQRAARPASRRSIDRARPRLARGDRGRQGLRDVRRRAGPQLPRLPRHRRPATATRTGSSSTTAGCSCRRGARSSSG